MLRKDDGFGHFHFETGEIAYLDFLEFFRVIKNKLLQEDNLTKPFQTSRQVGTIKDVFENIPNAYRMQYLITSPTSSINRIKQSILATGPIEPINFWKGPRNETGLNWRNIRIPEPSIRDIKDTTMPYYTLSSNLPILYIRSL